MVCLVSCSAVQRVPVLWVTGRRHATNSNSLPFFHLILFAGMLWTVCDTFADTTAAPKAVETPGKKKPPSSPLGPGRPSLRSMWPTMLFELRSLAVDFRPEVQTIRVTINIFCSFVS